MAEKMFASLGNLVCVLGMHRSGTSAVTGGIAALGADAGDRLMPPGLDNPKGYWEDIDIYAINEEILSCIGSSWDSIVDRLSLYMEFIPKDIHQRAVELLRSKMRNGRTVVVKDPRFCVLLPFWKTVMNRARCRPVYVLVVRNPLDVAQSLQNRNSIPLEQGLLLWFYYNALCLRDLHSDFLVASYERFMRAPFRELKRISDFTDLDFEAAGETVNRYVEAFLEPALQHYNSQLGELALACKDLFPEIQSMYEMLLTHQDNDFISAEVNKADFSRFWDAPLIERCAFINRKHERRGELTVRFDHGNGEEYSVKKAVSGNRAHVHINLSHLGFIKSVQVNIEKRQCIVGMESFRVELPDGTERELVPQSGNYAMQKGNKYVFDAVDPHLTVDVGCSLKTFRFSCSFLGDELEAAVCLLPHYREGKARRKVQILEALGELESVREELRLALKKLKSARAESELVQKELESTRAELKSTADKSSMMAMRLSESNSMIEHVVQERDALGQGKRLLEDQVEEQAALFETELGKYKALLLSTQEMVFNLELKENIRQRRYRAPLRALREAFLAMNRPLETRRYLKAMNLVKKSGSFDCIHYLKNNRDVLLSATDPLRHFLTVGWREGRNPSAAFDVSYYRDRYIDVRQGGVNPLVHYIVRGRDEGRFPTLQGEEKEKIRTSGFFDEKYYLENNEDVAKSGVDPLEHFYSLGWKEGRNPGPEFDLKYYTGRYEDVLRSNFNPLIHYIDHGQKEGRFATRQTEESR